MNHFIECEFDDQTITKANFLLTCYIQPPGIKYLKNNVNLFPNNVRMAYFPDETGLIDSFIQGADASIQLYTWVD